VPKKPKIIYNEKKMIKNKQPRTPNAKRKSMGDPDLDSRSTGANEEPVKKFGRLQSNFPSHLSSGSTQLAFSEEDPDFVVGYSGEKKGALFMGMHGKPGVTKLNLFAIPLLMFLLMLTDADVIYTISYFTHDTSFWPNLDKTQADALNSNAASVGNLISIPMVFISGAIFDIAGRRITIVIFFLLGSLATIGFTLLAPSQIGFTVSRVALACSMAPLVTNPFINDYVVTEDRGKASGIQSAGTTMGNIFSVMVLFTITRSMGSYWYQFGLLAFLQAVWAVLLWCITTEPKILSEKEVSEQNKKSILGKIWSLTKLTAKACR
jgi:MFS family permease